MERIAFIWGPYMVYWSTAILALACAGGVLLFLFLYLWDEADTVGGFCAAPLSLGLGMALSRLAWWHFRPDGFEDLRQALTDYSRGGFVLAGAFPLVAVLTKLLKVPLLKLGALLGINDTAAAGLVATQKQWRQRMARQRTSSSSWHMQFRNTVCALHRHSDWKRLAFTVAMVNSENRRYGACTPRRADAAGSPAPSRRLS